MATQSIWLPKEEGLREICSVLEQHISPTSSDKSRIYQQLQHYTQFPEFNNYLAFIFSSAQGTSIEIRQAAGLLLKNNLKTSFKYIDPVYQLYIKSEMLTGLGAVDKRIRTTAGTIISVIVQQGRIFGWPELLQALIQCLDSNDINLMEGAMGALSKICEDIPQELDSKVLGLAERPIDMLLPRLLLFFQSPYPFLRKLSLESVYELIRLMPSALYQSMDKYLHGLFVLGRDPVAEVRKLVCLTLVRLVEVNSSLLEPHMRNIIDFMLQASKDNDEEVALQACEFWLLYSEAKLNTELLGEFLQHLIPVLLSNMVYADDDESLIDAEEDDSLPDRDQDDDSFRNWNLRKCSAADLGIMSEIYGKDILPILMPIVEAKLSASDDETWKDREAAVMALGAIAEGCIGGLYPHLAEIVAYLIPVLDDKFPLVRSITCWTLSRFSRFIVECTLNQKGGEQFKNVLMGLLWRTLDTNKQVQQAACSAFAALEEEAAEELAPYLEIILQHLISASGRYQRKNLRILYDAIRTLANAVGMQLNQPRYLEILMPPLIAKWQQLSDLDNDLFPLLECFASISQALGTAFSQFAGPLFKRCINIIRLQHLAKVNPTSAGVQYDEDFIVCTLDFLSGLAEGLGGEIENLVSQRNLMDVLQCCVDDVSDVQISALAFLLNLARVCPGCLLPILSNILNVASKKLGATQLRGSISVANTACRVIEELAVKVPEEVSPFVMTVISFLVPNFCHAEGHSMSLVEYSAITLGRLAWACPQIVSPHMEHFMQAWCIALSMIGDDTGKEDAFRGLCAIVRLNPYGALNSLVYICRAIASWHIIQSKDLYNEVCQMLHAYKQMLGDGSWEQCMSALDPLVKNNLRKFQV